MDVIYFAVFVGIAKLQAGAIDRERLKACGRAPRSSRRSSGPSTLAQCASWRRPASRRSD